MNHLHAIENLGHLWTLQRRSLPRRLLRAGPHVRPGDEHIVEMLREVVARQEDAARRLADMILQRRGQLPLATYPMRFANWHYLDVRFLLSRLLDEQRRVVEEVQRSAEALRGDQSASDLARLVVAQELAHQERFEELHAALDPGRRRPASAPLAVERANRVGTAPGGDRSSPRGAWEAVAG